MPTYIFIRNSIFIQNIFFYRWIYFCISSPFYTSSNYLSLFILLMLNVGHNWLDINIKTFLINLKNCIFVIYYCKIEGQNSVGTMTHFLPPWFREFLSRNLARSDRNCIKCGLFPASSLTLKAVTERIKKKKYLIIIIFESITLNYLAINTTYAGAMQRSARAKFIQLSERRALFKVNYAELDCHLEATV